ncbi:ABC transporter ATP-binding protein [Thermoanaerobacter sp. CM-CNRG TB177]|uniref:ABC transporter ATP-binding protein n=1 Tax=Thermoanaerobacter sp. CM-CNRG TB177 TaxID=2800659 RepID=UPI001BDEA6EF|nr:ABC transporter ATP-binding protein [Thermoanaerobacter sp. CM-CNRG TB177]MBT1279724.1 ABC transporter ATP-binding protein [Thermoanaerobacter sp. CM-CNRG TB177]
MAVTGNIISVKNLCKGFAKNVIIFENLSIEMPKNKIIGLIGPNGSGKTTFIKLLSGMILPDSGEILVDGLNVQKEFLAVKRIIGIMPDTNRNLYWNLSGYKNIEYFAILKGLYNKRERNKIIEELISELNMESFVYKKVESYSKGMKQRLMFLIALLGSPKLLLLDEPLNGLDFENSLLIKDIILKFVKKGLSVIISSHDKYFLEEICDIKYIIKDKKLVIASPTNFVSKELRVYFKILDYAIGESLKKYSYEVIDNKKGIYSIQFKMNDYDFLYLAAEAVKNKKVEILSIVPKEDK